MMLCEDVKYVDFQLFVTVRVFPPLHYKRLWNASVKRVLQAYFRKQYKQKYYASVASAFIPMCMFGSIIQAVKAHSVTSAHLAITLHHSLHGRAANH